MPRDIRDPEAVARGVDYTADPDGAADLAAMLVHRLVAAFPAQRIAEPTVVLWVEALTSVVPADARSAVTDLLRTSRRFPALADFYRAVDDVRERRSTADEGRALPPADCPVCGGWGWRVYGEPGEPGADTVAPCPRGCPPIRSTDPTPDDPMRVVPAEQQRATYRGRRPGPEEPRDA